MSASTETLLLQIIELENMINESKLRGEDCTQMEEMLFVLRGKFSMMNEALKRTQGVLKG